MIQLISKPKAVKDAFGNWDVTYDFLVEDWQQLIVSLIQDQYHFAGRVCWKHAEHMEEIHAEFLSAVELYFRKD